MREAQRLSILDLPRQILKRAASGAFPADIEHVGIDIGDGDVRSAPCHAEGDVAGAAGHVEYRLSRPRLHPRHEPILPKPVHPGGHKVVHQVVTARNRTEDRADAPCLLLWSDDLVAEIDLGFHVASASSGLETRPPYRGPCPNCLKSRSRCAVLLAFSKADGSQASKRAAPIFADRCRPILDNA